MPLPLAWSSTSASSAAAASRSKARSVTRNTDQLVYRISSFRSRALGRCLSSLPAAVSVMVKSLVTPNESSLRPSRPAATAWAVSAERLLLLSRGGAGGGGFAENLGPVGVAWAPGLGGYVRREVALSARAADGDLKS